MTPALTCNELRPLLGGYVFEALEPDEAEAVRAHLPGCPACAAELASLAELPQLLDLAAPVSHPAEPLAPSTEEALLDRVARESDRPRPRPKRRRLPRIEWTRPRVAIASALIAAVVAVTATAMVTRDTQPASSRRYVVALHAGAAAPKAKAGIALYRVHGGTGVHLWAKGLAAGLQAGLRDALREREVDDERGHVPRRRPRSGERAAHDRGTGRGIRPRQRRH